jgi:hypothetical protein
MTLNPILPLEYAVPLLAAVSAGGLWLTWRASRGLPRRLRPLAFAARGGALLVLAAVALNVGRWRGAGTDEKPRWCVLVDRSASMATADVDGRSRWTAARAAVARLERAAGAERELDILVFSGQAEEALPDAGGLDGLTPDGRASDAGRAVAAATAGAGGRTAGIVLLTDGRQTVAEADPVLAGMRARAQDAPVLAVALGQARKRQDLSVKVARRLVVGFAGQPARIQGEVAAQWPNEVRVAVELVDGTGAAVATHEVLLQADGRAPVAFSVTPERAGRAAYALRVAPWEGESDARNNEEAFEINALDRKIRVLLVEGVPYWDSKFLGQHLRSQANMEVTSVSRTAPDRFFTVAPDGVSHAEAEEIFPDTAAKLAAYDIVVFGKGAEYVMTPSRSAALKAFVAEQGGSVVFARGRPYAEQGGGLEELEPVAWTGAASAECRLVPRPEGEDAGLFAGQLPGRGDAVWTRLPPVRCSQSAVQLKSFAQVLAEGRRTAAGSGGGTAAQAVPLLVSRRFGKGMAVTVNADGLWQWSFFPSAKEAAAMYGDLWAQVLLWAGTYAEFLPGHRYAVQVSAASVGPETPVRVQVRRRGAGGGGTPRLRVARGEETVQEVAPAAGERADAWEAVLTLAEPGLYRVTVEEDAPKIGTKGAREGNGGEAGVLLHVKAPPGELDEVNPDLDYLARLAEASGGRVVTAEALDEAMAQRERARARPAGADGRTVWEPLWDRGWLLVAILAALAAEWTVRRRNGLA